MSRTSLDKRYFNWLTSQVANVRPRGRGNRTFVNLFWQLHETIFVAIVPHDENRIADCRDLRYEFLAGDEEEPGDPNWTREPATMLELLIVLSRQLSFETGDVEDIWFWHLIQMLEIERFDDRHYTQDAQEVIASALDRVIWRTYEPNGHGGLFPLQDSSRDQRKVELWYQLNAYLLEQL